MAERLVQNESEVSIMVEFTNIVVKDGYIYADAYDVDFNQKRKIKLSTTTEDYSLSGSVSFDECYNIIKALWSLQKRYNKRGKLDNSEVVSWG